MRALVLSAVLHGLLGLALAALVWLVGLGLAGRRRGDGIYAYPLGLLAITVAALLYLVSPWLGAVGALALLVPLALGGRQLGALARAARPLLWGLPSLLGLSVATGLLLHGPSASLDSRAYGDFVYYVAKLVSAARSVVPLRDLLVSGQNGTYVEGAPTFIGAVLSRTADADPFLFHTTTLYAFLLASLCLGLGFLRAGRDGDRRAVAWAPALAAVATAAVAYPTWVPESAPVAMALPLAFPIYGLWRDDVPAARRALLAAAVVVDAALTKGYTAVPFLVLLGVGVMRDFRGRIVVRRVLAPALLVLVLGGAALAFFVATTGWLTRLIEPTALPVTAARGVWHQLATRSTQDLAPAAEVAGQVLLLVVLLRARAFAVGAALAVSLAATWFVGGYGWDFDIAAGVMVLVAALHLWQRPELLLAQRRLVAPAGAALALSAWLREVGGVRAGMVLLALLGATLLAAFAWERRDVLVCGAGALAAALLLALAGRPFVAALVLAAVALLALAGRRAAVVGAAAALAVAAAAATRGDLRLSDAASTLTSADYDVWHRASRVVPSHGLVFTTLTGAHVDGEHGWNYYPGVAGRQLYIGGWFDSPLLVDAHERARRLALNHAVVTGARRPQDAPWTRGFDGYYAVLRRRERRPPSFRLLYRNGRFALYRIES